MCENFRKFGGVFDGAPSDFPFAGGDLKNYENQAERISKTGLDRRPSASTPMQHRGDWFKGHNLTFFC